MFKLCVLAFCVLITIQPSLEYNFRQISELYDSAFGNHEGANTIKKRVIPLLKNAKEKLTELMSFDFEKLNDYKTRSKRAASRSNKKNKSNKDSHQTMVNLKQKLDEVSVIIDDVVAILSKQIKARFN